MLFLGAQRVPAREGASEEVLPSVRPTVAPTPGRCWGCCGCCSAPRGRQVSLSPARGCVGNPGRLDPSGFGLCKSRWNSLKKADERKKWRREWIITRALGQGEGWHRGARRRAAFPEPSERLHGRTRRVPGTLCRPGTHRPPRRGRLCLLCPLEDGVRCAENALSRTDHHASRQTTTPNRTPSPPPRSARSLVSPISDSASSLLETSCLRNGGEGCAVRTRSCSRAGPVAHPLVVLRGLGWICSSGGRVASPPVFCWLGA